MDKFVIIKIEDNHINPDGHSLIVKANHVENAPGFEHLSEMFGKKYYTYSSDETFDTEIFVFPFSQELLDQMLYVAKQQDEDMFWEPDLSLFYDARLQLRDGTIKMIHKSIEFKKKNSLGKHSTKSLTFIPPVADWEFSHKEVLGYKCIVYPATLTNVKDTPNGGFSYDSGEIVYFVFPDNDYYNRVLRDAISLKVANKEFWMPNLDDFCKYRVDIRSILACTTHDLYISNDLPTKLLMENLNQLFN